jgi:hypothetical protein
MPLTDIAMRNAQPCEKPYKLFDSRGLFLLMIPAGHRYWRFTYRFIGKEQLLSLGAYPDVRLKEAEEGARRPVSRSEQV